MLTFGTKDFNTIEDVLFFEINSRAKLTDRVSKSHHILDIEILTYIRIHSNML